MREKIGQAIKDALAQLGAGEVTFIVERPRSLQHGDYATNAALVAKVDAQALAEKLTIEGVEKVEVVGKFINFFLAREALVPQPQDISQLYAGKTVMVEYTDPNPFKEFHIGHLMSNTIGEGVARVLEAAGAKVVRANYQGDVGLHVAKTIWAVKNHKVAGGSWGDAYVQGNKAYETDEVAKKEIEEINTKVYNKSDGEINEMYENGRTFSLAHFEEIYKKLGTKFDHYFFESETWEPGLSLVKENTGSVFVESEGAVIYPGEQDGLHTRVFVNKAGLPTYEAKDLGLLALKNKVGGFDTSITVTASEQQEYFKVVLAAAKHIDEIAGIAQKTKHITHGMMRFAEGKMSSRTGNVITGESLLSDLIEQSKEKMQGRELADPNTTAQQIAVGAIKYAVLKQGSGRDIVFDPQKSLSLEGDSGPYLQYALTRALSLANAAKEAGINPGQDDMPEEASILERTLIHYSSVVERAAREMEPHYITTYLTELAGAFNSWYANGKVIGGTSPHYGVWLTYATIKTLREGLNILGIPAPEEM